MMESCIHFVPALLGQHLQVILPAAVLFAALTYIFDVVSRIKSIKLYSDLYSYCKFFYASFLKPHEQGDETDQQFALESFYRSQAQVYDATRSRLLRGREDLLGLLAAQLKHKVGKSAFRGKPVWVDIGGGTGYNIEVMNNFVEVENFFSAVYLVDLSPSLCEIARKRFQRLGWRNVSVVCQDARAFRLPETEHRPRIGGGADLISLSYSLSMIPDYYSVIDCLSAMLSPFGMIGVCDFYVQSVVDISNRSYCGGSFNRHVNWLGRVFWRAWFDVDRVGLEPSRRDYLEYKFGTVASANSRNHFLGGLFAIPYYMFIGCPKYLPSSGLQSQRQSQELLEKLDAAFTESPYLSPANHQRQVYDAIQNVVLPEIRSKAFESAVLNLASDLPLPSAFYQNHHWRIYYNDLLKKHTQFRDEYIYAFNWEDPRVDQRLLSISSDDVILTITSAGDNVLDYLQHNPRRLHAVDLNPSQNHLLELKVACFSCLEHADIWKIFGEGKHPAFRDLLVSKLSPHLSSQALQYWLNHSDVFSLHGRGLYESGGTRIAIKLVRLLFKFLGLSREVRKLCSAGTLNEQREVWPRIRSVLMSKPLFWAVVGTEWFSWKAAGVPPAQRRLIQQDHLREHGLDEESVSRSKANAQAVWNYVLNTLDPVVQNTLISNDNYFYLLCLQGKYSRMCHPTYLTPKAHLKLSRPNAFDGLRIHTDNLIDVLERITPDTLTIAVVMDSMDWFDPKDSAAISQVLALNQALKPGGRVLLRSASLKPWYVDVFEAEGFATKRVAERRRGKCIDRVNMYASTWICTKIAHLTRTHSPHSGITKIPPPAEPTSPSPLDLERTFSRTSSISNSSTAVEQLQR